MVTFVAISSKQLAHSVVSVCETISNPGVPAKAVIPGTTIIVSCIDFLGGVRSFPLRSPSSRRLIEHSPNNSGFFDKSPGIWSEFRSTNSDWDLVDVLCLSSVGTVTDSSEV